MRGTLRPRAKNQRTVKKEEKMDQQKIFTGLVSTSGTELSDDDYHSDVTRVSSSMLKTCWAHTPAHVYAQYIDSDREVSDTQKQAFLFGAVFHASILEQAEFDNRFVVIPEGIDYRSKDGKALKADIEASGKRAFKHSDWVANRKLVSKFLAHPFFAQHPIKSAIKEVAILGDGVRCKPDLLYVYGDRAVVVDVKTCADASPRGFQRTAYRMGYHIQAAWYADMVSELYGVPAEFYFACAEKGPAYLPAFYRASDGSLVRDDLPVGSSFIEIGRKQYQEAWTILKNCIASGQWTGYDTDTMVLDVPDWVAGEDQADSIVFTE